MKEVRTKRRNSFQGVGIREDDHEATGDSFF